MPAIAFGTGSKLKGQDVTECVEQAIETGFSHIDTAQWYANEDSIGKAIRETALERSELFVTTKWSGRTSIPGGVRDSLDKASIHVVPNAGDVWREFEKIKEEGLTKSIGVCNYSLPKLQELVKTASIIPAVNQILFHPYNYAENKELLEFCTQHGIVIEAYGSLIPITKLRDGPVDKPVQAAAKRLNATPRQVILSWVRSKGVVIVTASSSKEYFQEYLAVADLPPLTEEEVAAIDEAGARGRSVFIRRARFRLAFSVLQLVSGLWKVYTFCWDEAGPKGRSSSI
ncbi:NAD/NADP-dependent indole-3-acetaldehyde reductase [Grifola frondosa]|uniref:NAD/NADP-dependent indole-3-acetaldehyde reductase n=1 Tax=Grifola frondosa TaxID=5627 RepID=A0A1C7M500_GRIFR|nr:NAD/NADP-dependent indole-3-acetaldehyde reductase [Grifola frondosa]